MSRSLEIAAADGTIDAHVITPGNAGGPLPAVVLVTDTGGLRPCYHEKAQQIAENRYAVLMPNLYYRDANSPVVLEGKSFGDTADAGRLCRPTHARGTIPRRRRSTGLHR